MISQLSRDHKKQRLSIRRIIILLLIAGTFFFPVSQSYAEELEKEAPNKSLTDKAMLKKASLLNSQGEELYLENKFSEALVVLLKSLEIRERVLGVGHIETATSYHNVGGTYESMKNYPKTLEFYKKSLESIEQALGEKHLYTAVIYDNIGRVYKDSDNYLKALEFFDKALMVRSKSLNKDHSDVAISYGSIGVTYHAMGNYTKALSFHNKSLVIRENSFGKEHLFTAVNNNNIGLTYHSMGNYQKALEFYKKALVTREREMGKSHSATKEIYQNMVQTYVSMGNYKKALEYNNRVLGVRVIKLDDETAAHFRTDQKLVLKNSLTASATQDLAALEKISSLNEKGEELFLQNKHSEALDFLNRALLLAEKTWGKNHANLASFNNNLGVTYHSLGDYSSALIFHGKALQIRESSLGKKSPETASSYEHIGLSYEAIGEYFKAIEFIDKALKVKEEVLGESHIDTARSYNYIGLTYYSIGDYPKALDFHSKALAVREKVLGKYHLDTAISYDNLGLTYQLVGNYEKAFKFHHKALLVMEQILGSEHLETATVYSNIGFGYQSVEDLPRALDFYNKALSVMEKLLGKEHPDSAVGYSNIGATYHLMGNYPKAIEFHEKAMLAREKVLGREHPDTAGSYNNIGLLYHSMGNNTKALEFLEKALAIWEKVLGKNHPYLAINYNNIGVAYDARGDYKKSYQFAKMAFSNFSAHRNKNFSSLSTSQKKQFLKSSNGYVDYLLLHTDHYIDELIKNDKLKETINQNQIITNDWLAYKGSILDSENRLLQLAKTSKDPVVNEHYTALVTAKRIYGKLSESTPSSIVKIEEWKTSLTAQADKVAQLEQTIVKLDPRFNDEKELQVITSQEIAKGLSPDTLYIDFAKTNDGYYLFTIDHQNSLSFDAYSSAESEAIDEAISAFQANMEAITKDQKLINQSDDTTRQALSKLYELLFTKELLARLANKTSVIISPDGALRLLPFEALFNETDNEYLVESTDIRYIASGKELVRLLRQNKDQTSNQNKAVLFANPDFGGKPSKQSADARGSEVIVIPNTNELRTLSLLESLQPNFQSLPGTQREVDAIAKEIPHDEIKQGRDANEAYLLEVKQPNVLHLATHGFFLEDIPNPMLKSGLILAGANLSLKQSSGDGIVTALDLSGLDLQGTDLVVLSACETGKVDPNNTDGISGLSKAFIQAGAKDVVMSLWSVADDETAALMTAFYKAGKADQQYAKALRESKLAMLDKGLHPYYWAAFVLSGL